MAKIINKEEKRYSIAIASINLFCKKGIQQTSIEEIAKSAGVGKGTVYLYFKNKEEIVFAIWDILSQEHEEYFYNRVNENMSEREKILKYFNFSDIGENHDNEQILILYQHFISSMLIDQTNLYTNCFEGFFQKDYEFILECLNRGISKGEFVVENVNMLTHTIIMIIKGLIIRAKASNMGFNEVQQILTQHINYLLDQCTRKKS